MKRIQLISAMKFHAVYILLIFASCGSQAEVFSLWPFGSKAAGASDYASAVSGQKLWSEPVEINGLGLTLDLMSSDYDIDSCLESLKRSFPGAKSVRNADSALLEIKNKDGSKRRLYIVRLDAGHPSLIFSMDLPANLPALSAAPSELPAPSGFSPESSVRLKKRGSVFGSFSFPGNPEEAAAALEKSASASGWKPALSGKKSGTGTSGVFLRGSPPAMLLSSFNYDSAGKKSYAALYYRKVK